MENKNKVLFLSPYCSKNGAEMMLNNVINILGDKISACYFFEHEGFLKEEIKIKSYFLKTRSVRYILYYLINKVFKTKLTARELFLINIERNNKFEIWYVHTVYMLWTVKLAKKLNKKVIIHLHDYLYQYQNINAKEFQEAIEYADLVITCADYIKDEINNFAVKECKTVNECVDFDRVEKQLAIDVDLSEEEYYHKPYILMSGNYNYRKGIDLFVELAEVNKNFNFVCVGPGNSAYKKVLSVRKKSRKINNLFLLESKSDSYYHIVRNCKAFVLSSREDPFPLVMIEAAYFGKPIFGFKSGGISEFLKDGMGKIIPDLSVKKLSEEINNYAFENHDVNLSKERALEFDGNLQAKQIFTSINSLA